MGTGARERGVSGHRRLVRVLHLVVCLRRRQEAAAGISPAVRHRDSQVRPEDMGSQGPRLEASTPWRPRQPCTLNVEHKEE